MMFAPLEGDDQEDMFRDDLLNVADKAGVQAGDGIVIDKESLGRLKKADADSLSEEALARANKFITDWYWPKVQDYRAAGMSTAYAIERIQLIGGSNARADPTGRDGGWGYYRKAVQTLFNRPGGVLNVVEEVMDQAGATPAHAWRQRRDENRRSVESEPLNEYDVPLPGGCSKYMGGDVHDAIAEAVFGPGALGTSGKPDTVYAKVGQVLGERMWERLSRRLTKSVMRSRSCHETCLVMMKDARRIGSKEAMDDALRALKRWQIEAESTLEALDAPFNRLKGELSEIYDQQGYTMADVAAAMQRRTRSKREYRSRKKISKLASAMDVSASQEAYELFCETLQKSLDAEIPLGPPCNRVQLLEGYEEIGTEKYRGVPQEELMAHLGLQGMSHLPLGNPGSPGSKPINLMCHQVAGICTVLEHAFTAEEGRAGLATMICDEVGLGKTGLLIGVIQMIAHLRQQQESSPDKKLIPPPLATGK
ncbi:SNF2 family amino-terminal protein [Ceratobasidium sp. AG-Ba]|nr:SNF2 family amino-terminal protein [Ceratobasidium sp. AG-Ba]